MSAERALAALIEARIGVRVRSSEPLARHLRERVVASGLADAETYVARLTDAPASDPEILALVRAFTNGQTFFFRDDEQLRSVVDHLAQRAAMPGVGTLQLWCAACATGEEPYSLAMLCIERGLDVRILATDVNDARIEHARAALYDDWSLRHLPPALAERYLERVGRLRRVRTSVRNRVEFLCHNLLDAELPPQADRPPVWDVVLCRNFFIYLSDASVSDVVRKIAVGLAEEGLLVLGTAEALRGAEQPVEPTTLAGRVVYRRARAAPPVRASSVPPPIPEPEPVVDVELPPCTDRWVSRLSAGHVHLRAHELKLALARYHEARAAAEVEAEPSFFVGLVELKRGRLEAARDALRRAVFLEPDAWRSRLLLAGVLERLGDRAGAGRALAQVGASLASPDRHPPFRSAIEGIAAAEVTAPQARRSVTLRLAALGSTGELDHG